GDDDDEGDDRPDLGGDDDAGGDDDEGDDRPDLGGDEDAGDDEDGGDEDEGDEDDDRPDVGDGDDGGGSGGESDNPNDVTINTPTEDVGSDRPLTPEETDAPADVGVREGGDADSVSDADEADDRPDMNGSTPGRDAPQVDRPGDVGVRDGALDGAGWLMSGGTWLARARPGDTMPRRSSQRAVGDGASDSDSPQDIGVRFGGRDGQSVTGRSPDSVRDGRLRRRRFGDRRRAAQRASRAPTIPASGPTSAASARASESILGS
ncbi:MAG: hypothetical protein IPO67_27020, partial [Deltaproteobacteria bacterium]|nr:hypothetical protein [Deltaproteobacteria bacterium]